MRIRRDTEERNQRIKDLVLNHGCSTRQVAERMSLHTNTVSGVMNRFGYEWDTKKGWVKRG